jgi:iron complex transport system substrate-binding protein
MRIASLVPSATEMLFALGLGDRVVAVTHECDYPPAVRSLPDLTRSVLPAGLSPADVDRQVKARVMEGRPLYELDEELLAELAPDLIVTQALWRSAPSPSTTWSPSPTACPAGRG